MILYKDTQSKIAMLMAFILGCLVIELWAGIWTQEGVTTWYPTLNKPSWTPPNFVFGPVWTILYLMIAISGWLIWKTHSSIAKKKAYFFYFLQLFLNLIWSKLFFSLQNPFLGFIDITILSIVIIINIFYFYQINRFAALMLIPYLLWIFYALSLNLAIIVLN